MTNQKNKSNDAQARFIDTNRYYREGGVDPNKAKQYNDILAIQAGIGTVEYSTLKDQIDICSSIGLDYITWLIPDPDNPASMRDQTLNWFGMYKVEDAPMAIDLESPRSGTRYINAQELKEVVDTIREVSNYPVIIYSRVNILEDLFPTGFPDWINGVLFWIAQYLLDSNGYQYKYYEPFLENYEFSYPPSVERSYLFTNRKEDVIAWQFTEKGDAPKYIAVDILPGGGSGIKSCDLNVSMDTKENFMKRLFGEDTEDCPCDEILASISELYDRVEELERRVELLENDTEFYREMRVTAMNGLRLRSEPETGDALTVIPYNHTVLASDTKVVDSSGNGYWLLVNYQDNSTEYMGWCADWYLQDVDFPAEPPPSNDYVTVTAEKAVAMAAVGYNNQGKPIIEKNVYQETNDPQLKWKTGDRLKVKKDIVEGDGNTKWYSILDIPLHGYNELYVNKTKVVKE